MESDQPLFGSRLVRASWRFAQRVVKTTGGSGWEHWRIQWHPGTPV